MTFRRCIGTMLAASVSILLLCATDVSAFGRRSMMAPNYGYGYNPYGYGYAYPQFNPYMSSPGYGAMPLPGYGVTPLPLATLQMLGYDFVQKEADTPQLDYVPRKRPSLYPAVPYDPTPQERAADLKRAKFEITVPTADAIVLFDGAKTTQKGLNRRYFTPALVEDKLYTATIEVQWTDEAGTKVTRRRTFEFVAGETITHRFGE